MIKAIKKVIQTRSPLDMFLIRAGLMFVLFMILKTLFNKGSIIYPVVDEIKESFAVMLMYASKTLLSLAGFKVEIYLRNISIVGSRGVLVGNACIGWYLMALFAGFIIIYPGKLTSKLWFIPLGIIIINLLNIIRISILTVIAHCCYKYLEINHTYIFQITVYVCIFIMWIIWIIKYKE